MAQTSKEGYFAILKPVKLSGGNCECFGMSSSLPVLQTTDITQAVQSASLHRPKVPTLIVGDGDLVLLARALIHCRYIQDAVGVDVKRHLNLGHATGCRWNAGQLKLAQQVVILCHGTLTLIDLLKKRQHGFVGQKNSAKFKTGLPISDTMSKCQNFLSQFSALFPLIQIGSDIQGRLLAILKQVPLSGGNCECYGVSSSSPYHPDVLLSKGRKGPPNQTATYSFAQLRECTFQNIFQVAFQSCRPIFLPGSAHQAGCPSRL